jgi:hypothetical protein
MITRLMALAFLVLVLPASAAAQQAPEPDYDSYAECYDAPCGGGDSGLMFLAAGLIVAAFVLTLVLSQERGKRQALEASRDEERQARLNPLLQCSGCRLLYRSSEAEVGACPECGDATSEVVDLFLYRFSEDLYLRCTDCSHEFPLYVLGSWAMSLAGDPHLCGMCEGNSRLFRRSPSEASVSAGDTWPKHEQRSPKPASDLPYVVDVHELDRWVLEDEEAEGLSAQD